MRLLIHICCAPCTVYPLQRLRVDGHDIHGLFYNPNIHPYREYGKRLDTLKTYADGCGFSFTYPVEYNMEDFLRIVAFREKDRCYHCYYERLKYSVCRAKEGKFEGFTSTLLYSKFQNHALIREIGNNLANEHNIEFYYRDFRAGWSEGVRLSREMGLYRQSYCGCIYSEKERYYTAK